MDYAVLFFLLIVTAITTQTTSFHHHCNSDVYSSAVSSMADLQQLTTLQYCLMDNCAIIRTDTGEQLDIVYTTQSLLVVTPTDGQTSMIISKNNPELFCSTSNTADNSAIVQVVALIMATLIMLVSGSIIVVHMIFKELHNTFGKLLILYNIGKIVQFFFAILHYDVALHSMMPCYLFYFVLMQSIVVGETFATSFLVYAMYYIYRCREVTKEINKKLYKYAIMFVLGASLLFCIFVVSYDFGIGTCIQTLLPNGHCIIFVQPEYNILRLLDGHGYINEIIKCLLLVAYCVYYYQLKKMVAIINNMPNTDTQQNRLFFEMAIMMGASLGISQIAYPFSWHFDNELLVYMIAHFLFIQLCVISLLMRSKEVS